MAGPGAEKVEALCLPINRITLVQTAEGEIYGHVASLYCADNVRRKPCQPDDPRDVTFGYPLLLS
jgi:hypothetical protein